MKKTGSKKRSPSRKAYEGSKLLGKGAAGQAAKKKMSRAERMKKALGQAQSARKNNTRSK
jgi:hypothetical protein